MESESTKRKTTEQLLRQIFSQHKVPYLPTFFLGIKMVAVKYF